MEEIDKKCLRIESARTTLKKYLQNREAIKEWSRMKEIIIR